jgi:hypothetical protein
MDRRSKTLIERRRPRLVMRRFVERMTNRLRCCVGWTPRPEIKIHGLLRSGTNYLDALLRRNFHVACLAPSEQGWKHGPCEYGTDLLYLFVVKDPYAWLVSFRNWERLHRRSQTVEIGAFARDRLTHERLRRAWNVGTPVEAWNRSLHGWLALEGRPNTLFVRYEDLIRDTEGQLERVRERFGLARRGPRLADIHSRADTWRTPNPRAALDRGYYLNEKYLEEFDERALSALRAGLDHRLLARFDYRLH